MTREAMRVARSRGVVSGLLVLLLGVWGALIPFVGPYFGYAYTPDTAWTTTAGRWLLEVVPGATAFLGGLLLVVSRDRATGGLGGWLGTAAGAWFVLGPVFSMLWAPGGGFVGQPVGGNVRSVMEQIGLFSGLGTVILFLSALALGRFTVHAVRDVQAAQDAAAARAARHGGALGEHPARSGPQAAEVPRSP